MIVVESIALWFEKWGIDWLIGFNGLIVFFVLLAILLRKQKILHYILLSLPVVLNFPIMFVGVVMSFVPGHGSDYPLIIPIFIVITGGLIMSAIIFAFWIKGKKIWHYFWFGWAIFLGFPVFLLMNWFV